MGVSSQELEETLGEWLADVFFSRVPNEFILNRVPSRDRAFYRTLSYVVGRKANPERHRTVTSTSVSLNEALLSSPRLGMQTMAAHCISLGELFASDEISPTGQFLAGPFSSRRNQG